MWQEILSGINGIFKLNVYEKENYLNYFGDNFLCGCICTGYGITDTCGVFTCMVSGGYHRNSITHLQYEDCIDSIDICRDTCLPPYILSERRDALAEAVVKANYVKRRGLAFTVTVKGNPLAEDRSTMSFLNQLPGVRGLSVNNRLAVVYINDREIKMPPDQIMRYLSNIPTESIENVKVVPVKDAKGKASGQKSAIYVTLRKSKEGERYYSVQNISDYFFV